MREIPILFSARMVRAVLEGRKTQTRRAVKLPHQNPLGVWEPIALGGPGSYLDKACTQPDPEPPRTFIWHTRTADMVACPYGKTGDRLWVRETWAPFDREAIERRELDKIFFLADDERHYPTDGRWRPGIHMPRWASRITLEILNVRVERLQAISYRDCLAEGIREFREGGFGEGQIKRISRNVKFDYQQLWDGLNEKRGFGWQENPWVWVVEFKRL